MRQPITTKQQMYRLLQRGAFGNIVQQWNSLAEVDASGYRGLVSMRHKEVNNPTRLYHIPYADLRETIRRAGFNPDQNQLVFSEAPPDHLRTIQGEVKQHFDGLALIYSYAPLPMRLALAQESRYAKRSAAHAILRHHLWPVDYEELMGLLDVYPDHTVEFTGFSVPVGVVPNRCMLIWECRAY